MGFTLVDLPLESLRRMPIRLLHSVQLPGLKASVAYTAVLDPPQCAQRCLRQARYFQLPYMLLSLTCVS